MKVLKQESGQAITEAAIATSLLLLLVMGVLEMGQVFFVKLTLQNAVRTAGRYAMTGSCIGSGGSCSLSRYDSVVQVLQNSSAGILKPANLAEVRISCTNYGGGCPNAAGGPTDAVSVSVSHAYHFVTPLVGRFFPAGSYTINVSAQFTNEQFLPSQS
jgi:Flp pilus assembly protein TadG